MDQEQQTYNTVKDMLLTQTCFYSKTNTMNWDFGYAIAECDKFGGDFNKAKKCVDDKGEMKQEMAYNRTKDLNIQHVPSVEINGEHKIDDENWINTDVFGWACNSELVLNKVKDCGNINGLNNIFNPKKP